MTVSGVAAALVIGIAIGAVGWLATPGRALIPRWLPLAVGISAALMGSITAGFVRAGTPTPRWAEMVLQIGLAAVGVGIVVETAGNRPPRNRS